MFYVAFVSEYKNFTRTGLKPPFKRIIHRKRNAGIYQPRAQTEIADRGEHATGVSGCFVANKAERMVEGKIQAVAPSYDYGMISYLNLDEARSAWSNISTSSSDKIRRSGIPAICAEAKLAMLMTTPPK